MSSSNNHNLNQGRDAPPSNQFEMEIDDDDYDPGPEEDILVYTTSRSDGRDKIRRGNVEIDNYPIGRDLIPTTKDGITSYFKEVDMNDDVSIDWRINLAEGCKEWAEAKSKCGDRMSAMSNQAASLLLQSSSFLLTSRLSSWLTRSRFEI